MNPASLSYYSVPNDNSYLQSSLVVPNPIVSTSYVNNWATPSASSQRLFGFIPSSINQWIRSPSNKIDPDEKDNNNTSAKTTKNKNKAVKSNDSNPSNTEHKTAKKSTEISTQKKHKPRSRNSSSSSNSSTSSSSASSTSSSSSSCASKKQRQRQLRKEALLEIAEAENQLRKYRHNKKKQNQK